MTTPNGLPFPESTDDFNQGANDIKALALALDPRSPFVVQSLAQVVAPSAGSITVTFPKAFTTTPVVVFSVYATADGAYVPCGGLKSVTPTNFVAYFLGIPKSAGPPSQIGAWGDPVSIHWCAFALPA